VLWSPLCGRFPTVFQGINAAISYLAPPITVVFVAGVFWKKASSRGAFFTLVTGSALGFTGFVLDFTKVLQAFKEAHPFFGFLNFMVTSFLLAVICAIILVVTSRLFPEPLTVEKKRLVWKSFREPLRQKGWPGWGDYKRLSIILALVMIALYMIFTFPLL